MCFRQRENNKLHTGYDYKSCTYIACVAGARRGREIGEIRRVIERKGSAWGGGGGGGVGGSACSKPIVWFVFHGRFPIVKIAIGQN